MCGRSSLTKTQIDLEKRFQSNFYSEDLERYNPLPNYNVAPSHFHPVLTMKDEAHFNYHRWGLIPSWSKEEKVGFMLINARVETLLEKASFKNLLLTNRCLIPFDGFYEWKKEGKTRIPYRIQTKDQEIFTMAGLVDYWQHPSGVTIPTFTIITLPANAFMEPIHDRMPAILPSSLERIWLDPSLKTEAVLEVLQPYDADQMTAYRVSDQVGNVRNNTPNLIKPIQDPPIQLSLFD